MRLIQLMLAYSRTTVAIAVLMGFLSGLCNAAVLGILNTAIRRFPDVPAALPWAFVGVGLVLFVSATLAQWLLAQLTQQIVYRLLLQLTQRILESPFQRLEQVGTAKLMAALTNDVEVISGASSLLSGLSINLALLLGCMGYLCWLSPSLFLFFTTFLVGATFLTHQLLQQARRSFHQAREDRDRLFKNFEGITLGIKELKLHAQRRHRFYQDELTPNASVYRDRIIQGMGYISLAGGLGLVLFFMPLGIMLFVLPHWFRLPVAILPSFTLVVIFILTPLRSILVTTPQLTQASISLNKLESLGLSLMADDGGEVSLNGVGHSQAANPQDWSQIDLREVTHSYGPQEDHSFCLGPLSLSLTPGEIVLIVGGNGSGKSTLMKLLTGLYQPEAGGIYLDGELIDANNRDRYRQLFSAVFADFYLFDRLHGLRHTDLDQQAQTYLTQLDLASKVTVANGRLSTTQLSQGQRKRLALLIAYLENRPIYVFDEWASDQDPVFKQVFYQQLLPNLKHRGKTVFVISHDDRYFDVGDRLIQLEYGQIRAA